VYLTVQFLWALLWYSLWKKNYSCLVPTMIQKEKRNWKQNKIFLRKTCKIDDFVHHVASNCRQTSDLHRFTTYESTLLHYLLDKFVFSRIFLSYCSRLLHFKHIVLWCRPDAVKIKSHFWPFRRYLYLLTYVDYS